MALLVVPAVGGGGAVNEALRSHVTRVGFDLTLGKTHIAALVYLNESIKQRRQFDTRPRFGAPRAFGFFASGARGLGERGLVVHHFKPDVRNKGLGPHYTITKAGKLVVDLLKEAGIYQEYADSLQPYVEVAS